MLDRAPGESAKDTATRRVRFRGAGFVPASSRFGGWIALALVIAIWQAAGSVGLVNALFLPTPLAIARAIYQLAISGALWQHLS
ncbi:ABC transporter permease, partial [Bradyrhizobium sp. SHOUNA76]|nr:ABC transporter permease [Bradyrhizobium sp. SHOUNA76]